MDPINPIAGNPEALNMENSDQPKQVENNHPSNNFTVISMALFILLCLGVVGFFYYQNQQLKQMLASYQTPTPSPTPTATTDPTANWKVFTFSPTVSFKLQSDIKNPLYVNAGHYAQETILPGNTTFQIWGADGASPSDGKDTYNSVVQKIKKIQGIITNEIQLSNMTALQFAITTPNSSLIQGGDTGLQQNGVAIEMPDSRALVIIHYKGQTLQKTGDFVSDENVFSQILSTFKFVSASPSAVPFSIPVSTSSGAPSGY